MHVKCRSQKICKNSKIKWTFLGRIIKSQVPFQLKFESSCTLDAPNLRRQLVPCRNWLGQKRFQVSVSAMPWRVELTSASSPPTPGFQTRYLILEKRGMNSEYQLMELTQGPIAPDIVERQNIRPHANSRQRPVSRSFGDEARTWIDQMLHPSLRGHVHIRKGRGVLHQGGHSQWIDDGTARTTRQAVLAPAQSPKNCVYSHRAFRHFNLPVQTRL